MNFSFSVAKPKPFRREAFWRLKGLGTDKVSNRFSLGKKNTGMDGYIFCGVER